MENFNLTKSELEALYEEELNDILEQCDWVSYITPEHICIIISNLMNKKGFNVPYTELKGLYMAEVKKINVGAERWNREFGVKEIIDIMHDILLKNF